MRALLLFRYFAKKYIKSASAMLVLAFQLIFMPVAYSVETIFWVDGQNGLAISGYDPISYFLSGKGYRGSSFYEYYWKGAEWRFENEGNLAAFRDSPLTYIPQFGGFDAVKMAANIKVSPDPSIGEVFENRLYLFHSKDARNKWREKRQKYILSARKNWLRLSVYDINKNFIIHTIKTDDISEMAPFFAKKRDLEQQQKDAFTKIEKRENDLKNEPPHLDSSSRMGAAGDHFKKKGK